MLLFISILVGMFAILIYNIIEYFIFGNRGKRGQITSYFNQLKGLSAKRHSRHINLIRTKKSIKNASGKNYMISAIFICVGIFLVSIMTFRSLYLAFFISLLGLVFPKIMTDNAARKKKELLDTQLRDALNSIVSSLKAGLSINSALTKCTDDLRRIYVSIKEKPMLDEFEKIRNDLNMGVSVDDALLNFKQRVNTEDVNDFVNSIIIVRQKGGNLVEVMDNVTKMITDKIAIKREISILTAGKKVEARVLTIIPILIIVSLSFFSRNYMEPLYSTLPGKALILMGFILLIINYFIGKRIVDIQV